METRKLCILAEGSWGANSMGRPRVRGSEDSRRLRMTMPVIHSLIHRLRAISVKRPGGFLAKIDNLILKVYGNSRDPTRSKQSWQRTKLENSHFPVSKLRRYRNRDSVVLARRVRVYIKVCKGRHIDQWNQTKNPEKPSLIWSINFQQHWQGKSMGERIHFLTNAGTPGYSHFKKWILGRLGDSVV